MSIPLLPLEWNRHLLPDLLLATEKDSVVKFIQKDFLISLRDCIMGWFQPPRQSLKAWIMTGRVLQRYSEVPGCFHFYYLDGIWFLKRWKMTVVLWQPRRVGWGERCEEGSRGRVIYLWLIHAYVWQKPTQYCKTIVLQLKINKLKKKSYTRQEDHLSV